MMDPLSVALEPYIPRLRRYALFLSGNRALADDLVHDCLSGALKAGAHQRLEEDLRPWLFRLLRVRFADHPGIGRGAPGGADGRALLEAAGARRTGHLAHAFTGLLSGLHDLASEHREALVLVVVEGLNYEAAARIMDVNVDTVRDRTQRARASLLRRIEPGAPPNGAERAYTTARAPARARRLSATASAGRSA